MILAVGSDKRNWIYVHCSEFATRLALTYANVWNSIYTPLNRIAFHLSLNSALAKRYDLLEGGMNPFGRLISRDGRLAIICNFTYIPLNISLSNSTYHLSFM